ncbi:MAG: 3-dehydroquinate synthase [Clostridia bacterium]|nr:3-dehydroquinate synthase [Clostridia bacterium]
MILPLSLGERSYDIVVRRGVLHQASEFLQLNRKALIVTDDGVPAEYAQTVAAQCATPVLVTLPQGETTKSMACFELLCRTMLEHGFTRTDCVVAVGGGVIGDLAGFAAASFMRGIDFYNLPTTLLSQVDSSIGGKVAIDLDGVKNIVGAFYQPKKVLIDPDTLASLDPRHLAAGMAEAVKMSATFDKDLFETIERADDPYTIVEDIIIGSLKLKRMVVEQDEKEQGLRKVLNFGHTVGHAVETLFGDQYFHGECVALGMLPMCNYEVRRRLIPLFKRLGLPTVYPECNKTQLMMVAAHDKKADGFDITVVFVPKIGEYEMRKIHFDQLETYLEGDLWK